MWVGRATVGGLVGKYSRALCISTYPTLPMRGVLVVVFVCMYGCKYHCHAYCRPWSFHLRERVPCVDWYVSTMTQHRIVNCKSICEECFVPALLRFAYTWHPCMQVPCWRSVIKARDNWWRYQVSKTESRNFPLWRSIQLYCACFALFRPSPPWLSRWWSTKGQTWKRLLFLRGASE